MIGTSKELAEAFQNASLSKNVRFIKVSIRNEHLEVDDNIPIEGSFDDDMEKLQHLVEDNVPAYILVNLESPESEWLLVSYVPETSSVKEKMIYATMKNSLIKSIDATHLKKESLFANSKADLSPSAYKAHQAHTNAPKPLSAREKELEELSAADRQAGGGAYESSRTRISHVGAGVGLAWSEDVELALKELGNGNTNQLVVISIDPDTETLVLTSADECDAQDVGKTIPSNDPSFALFAWSHSLTSPPRRDIFFIYACPSYSPIKHRMLYSSGSSSVIQKAKEILSSTSSNLSSRKIETSDPTEINEEFLKNELGILGAVTGGSANIGGDEKKGFARPKGPGRKR
ncbi:actin depolymerizing protein [Rickenella mellea]|uniref:Actin depolymerizing protein n=1 Tax=Rickenella mellea TaxID=50990 RepID=A0A4Y7QD11_9AGAM|nr:actin depolymerizing protein [Rickenella mellea]